MTQPEGLTAEGRRALVAGLVARSGIPASPAEVETLIAAAGPVQEAVQRLYDLTMEHETEPAVTLTQPRR